MTEITLTKGTLDERIRYFLQDNYACTRVWEAWSYGTMTEDDFTPMEEDEDIVADFKTLVQVEVDRAVAAQDKEIEQLTLLCSARLEVIERLNLEAQMVVDYEQLKVENKRLSGLVEQSKKIVKQIINDDKPKGRHRHSQDGVSEE